MTCAAVSPPAEKVLTFDGWPYGSTPVVVFSSGDLSIPDSLAGTVEAGSILARPRRPAREPRIRHAYVDGGQTIQGLLAAGLIDRLIVTRIPILLGSGKPLFGELPGDIRLRHVRTSDYPSGLVQSEYQVLGEPT